MISRLDVVNEMLGGMGELPMNSLDEGHPLAPSALRVLATANRRIQSMRWWFNREMVDLFPDTEGNIYVPNDTLQVDPIDQSKKFVLRGRRLYKPLEPTLAAKYTFTAKVRCWLLREVPFDDLPYSIQDLVSNGAQLDFMKSYEADAQKFQQITQAYVSALRTANAEHTRAMGSNMLHRRPIYNSLTEIGLTSLDANTPYFPHP